MTPSVTRDTGAVAARMTSSRMIGRTAELAELEAALTDAAAGRPSLVFVAGESGVGKTRILDEAARRAKSAGGRLLSGDCVELGEGELPYAPIVAALRPLARDGDPALDALPGGARAELTRLLPGLGLPSLPPVESEDVGAAQSRLFEALLSLLEELGSEHAVVLMIEDLHWADRSTRNFLTFLSRTICRERLLVVCSYRPDELHRRHPLRPLLAELERAERSRRIELAPLTRSELAEALTDILGGPPDDGLVDRLYRRSEGNPLFAEELLAAGLDGRGSLPPTLREALMLRIEALPATAQELLRLLAAGQRMDDELIEVASGIDPREVRVALRETISSHIIVASENGFYGFRHALLREVVHDDLLPGEHAELHRAIARALEERTEREGHGGAHRTAAIAHHYMAAGDQPAAFAASVRAADAAMSVQAYGEAGDLLDRAIELYHHVPDAETLAGADRARLMERAALARYYEGALPRSVALLEKALELVDAEADPRRVAMMYGRLERSLFSWGHSDEAAEALAKGLALLPDDEVSPERAWLLSNRTKGLMLRSRWEDAVESAREALPLAIEAGDDDARVGTLNSLGVALMGIGEEQDGIATLREAIEVATNRDFRQLLGSSYTNLADGLHLAGRSDEALKVALEGRSVTEVANRTQAWLSLQAVEILIDLGRLEEADSFMPRVDDRPAHGMYLANLDLRRAELALLRGDHETARTLLDEAGRVALHAGQPQFQGPHGAFMGELHRREGDLEAARAAIESAAPMLAGDTVRAARLAALGAQIEAEAADRARDLSRGDDAEQAAARAGGHAARAQASIGRRSRVERAFAAEADAHATRARGVSADDKLLAAIGMFEELGRPYPAASMLLILAAEQLRCGDRDAAAASAGEALRSAGDMGARWLANEARSFLLRARLALPEGCDDTELDGVEALDDDPFGLTPREREVLAMVAEGATNREIGERLFMAEKTASVHVSRILAKLDVRSRTEAAAVAHRHGLVRV
jgi:DNA-binding CsgD family transcriptional regulator/tetratricopeptide (TPR) repeat protein